MRIKTKGFSLIELLIVVAIILIIAPSQFPICYGRVWPPTRRRRLVSVRSINTASVTYNSTYNNGYPSTPYRNQHYVGDHAKLQRGYVHRQRAGERKQERLHVHHGSWQRNGDGASRMLYRGILGRLLHHCRSHVRRHNRNARLLLRSDGRDSVQSGRHGDGSVHSGFRGFAALPR